MSMNRLYATVASCAALLAILVVPVQAEDFFVPGAPKAAQQSAPRPAPTAPRPAPAPMAPQMSNAALPQILAPGGDSDAPAAPMPPLPPLAPLPPLEKAAPPPVAVIGVLGVPEIMHASLAAQAVDRIVGERREKLNQDAQKEQAAWRDMQQALASQRSTMSPDQIRARERELQERIANSQKLFRDRARIIQEAAQYGVGQIERALIAVIRQVAESHGMNLVLHRSQVALNVSEFDISEQVVTQLNKVLPSVLMPPDGVSPSSLPAPPGAVVAPSNGPVAGPVANHPAPTPAAGPRP